MNTPPLPAPRPCASCPYRRDVPAGVWATEEYDRLPAYDATETWGQPVSVFECHQRDGRLCAGWVAVHDMTESLGLRLAASIGYLTPEQYEAACDYSTDVPLFTSGTEAAEHGRSGIEDPDAAARRIIIGLTRRKDRR